MIEPAPLVSVVMPVFNGEDFLSESIESILAQTFRDWELIIVDDGSSDASVAVAQQFIKKDKRLRLVRNDENLGLACSLNRALRIASGKYIARMDSDDIAVANRLEEQVRFLTANCKIGIVGTWMQSFGQSKYVKKYPVSPEQCRVHLMFDVPVGHPSVMFRSALTHEHNLFYNEDLKTYGEDYDLWVRCSRHTQIANIPSCLMNYRTFPESKKAEDLFRRQQQARIIREKILRRLEIPLTPENIVCHQSLSAPTLGLDNCVNTKSIAIWAKRLSDWNSDSKTFSQSVFADSLNERVKSWAYHNPSMSSLNLLVRSGDFDLRVAAKLALKVCLGLTRRQRQATP